MSKLNKKLKTSKSIIILSFTILVIIPTMILSLVPYVISSDIIKSKIISNTTEFVERINFAAEKQTTKMESYINKISVDPQIQNILKETDFTTYNYNLWSINEALDDYIHSIFLEEVASVNVLLVDIQQGYYYFKDRIYSDESILRQSKWYQDTLNLDTPINWIGMQFVPIYTDSNSYAFITAKKILDSRNFDCIGVVYISYSLPYFESILPSTSESEELYIINSDGRLLLSSAKSQEMPNLTEEENNLLLSNKSGTFEKLINDKEYIFVYSSPNQHGWKTISKVPLVELMGDLDQIKMYTTLLILLCLILFLYFILYVFFRISRPLQYMVNSLDNMDENFDVEMINNQSSFYELAKLKSDISHMVDKSKATSEKLINTEISKKKIEIQKLQAQINPHFLYNTLTSIKYIAILNNQNKISQLITSLIKLLRNSINREGLFITIQQELENLRNYIYIQNVVYEDKIQFDFILDETLNDILIPNFILQPLVENCIFHGINPNDEKGIITIQNYLENNNIVFVIKDNGVGMDEEQVQQLFSKKSRDKNSFTGIGIKGVNDKIQLICGYEYGLEIESLKDVGTKFIITLPME